LKKNKCVNKNIPTQTTDEYLDKTKERRFECQKQYYYANKEELLAKNKEYREAHREEIYKREKIRATCEICGSEVIKKQMMRHQRTDKCKHALENKDYGHLCLS